MKPADSDKSSASDEETGASELLYTVVPDGDVTTAEGNDTPPFVLMLKFAGFCTAYTLTVLIFGLIIGKHIGLTSPECAGAVVPPVETEEFSLIRSSCILDRTEESDGTYYAYTEPSTDLLEHYMSVYDFTSFLKRKPGRVNFAPIDTLSAAHIAEELHTKPFAMLAPEGFDLDVFVEMFSKSLGHAAHRVSFTINMCNGKTFERMFEYRKGIVLVSAADERTAKNPRIVDQFFKSKSIPSAVRQAKTFWTSVVVQPMRARVSLLEKK